MDNTRKKDIGRSINNIYSKAYYKSNFPYSINITQKSNIEVYIQVNIINEFIDIKSILQQYCNDNNIVNTLINYEWVNKGLFSNKKSFSTYINIKNYKMNFGICNQLFSGRTYKFINDNECNIFQNDIKNIVEKYLDNNLYDFIIPELIMFMKWQFPPSRLGKSFDKTKLKAKD
ncbi:hypothetical protein SH1V18_48220 [Vallitalea longa]|uniref:Uncharacterized protein n=1 Tax=Vallitalea longa TaxID=2936439 RepID=A0A9W6DI78_9FIRM|nr:hypothetical protein [Vallitalea longa]GKX32342.1 hypothetical protein SH1V18_48220 [Vallitalea longa]